MCTTCDERRVELRAQLASGNVAGALATARLGAAELAAHGADAARAALKALAVKAATRGR